MIAAEIRGTAGSCPGPSNSTTELVERAGLDLPAAVVERKTGIRARHWDRAPGAGRQMVGEGGSLSERSAEIGAEVLRGALDRAGMEPGELRRLVFVNSTGGDFLIPATANAVLDRAGIVDGCDGFDLNNACMGFLTAFDLAARMVATGLWPVGVVSVELLSRFITPDDPRPYLVLGDAAGGAILDRPGDREAGVLASTFTNQGARRRTVYLGHPGLTGAEETIVFGSSNREISEGVVEVIAGSAERVVAEAGITLEQVDWLVPHQPNGSMLDAIVERLRFDPKRTMRQVETMGSVGSASIAMGLNALCTGGRLRRGQRVLMVGAGAGVSYGAVLFRY